MGNIAITPEILRETAMQVQTTEQEVTNLLATLRSKVLSLSDIWVGQAHAQFEGLYQQWQNDANGLNRALEAIAGLMQQAATAYSETEMGVSRTFSAR